MTRRARRRAREATRRPPDQRPQGRSWIAALPSYSEPRLGLPEVVVLVVVVLSEDDHVVGVSIDILHCT